MLWSSCLVVGAPVLDFPFRIGEFLKRTLFRLFQGGGVLATTNLQESRERKLGILLPGTDVSALSPSAWGMTSPSFLVLVLCVSHSRVFCFLLSRDKTTDLLPGRPGRSFLPGLSQERGPDPQ